MHKGALAVTIAFACSERRRLTKQCQQTEPWVLLAQWCRRWQPALDIFDRPHMIQTGGWEWYPACWRHDQTASTAAPLFPRTYQRLSTEPCTRPMWGSVSVEVTRGHWRHQGWFKAIYTPATKLKGRSTFGRQKIPTFDNVDRVEHVQLGDNVDRDTVNKVELAGDSRLSTNRFVVGFGDNWTFVASVYRS